MSLRSGLVVGLTAIALLAAPTAAADPGELDPGVVTVVQAPTIGGTAQVGATLAVATAPVWSPEDAVSTYQWLRNGEPIPEPDAADGDYTLTPADVGAAVAVQATGTKEGLANGTTVSAATATISKIAPVVTVRGSSTRVGALKLSITVSASPDAAPSGTVWVKRGTKLLRAKLPLSKGKASYTAGGIKPGRYTYSVHYAGTSRIAARTGSATVQIKAKARPSISLKPAASPGKVKIGITVTATGQPPLGGTAYVKEGSKTLKSGIKITKGKATWSRSGVKSGTHTYRVGYNGTSQVNPGSVTVRVKVPAPVKLVKYPNCAALNKVHPHGVGRSGAKDKVSGSSKPVTTFLRNTKLYELNTGRDRDKDGVACEKA